MEAHQWYKVSEGKWWCPYKARLCDLELYWNDKAVGKMKKKKKNRETEVAPLENNWKFSVREWEIIEDREEREGWTQGWWRGTKKETWEKDKVTDEKRSRCEMQHEVVIMLGILV